MGERPIIFSAPMVRAILAGRKTMTRRLATSPITKCQPGDRLWVREGLRVVSEGIEYAADDALLPECDRLWDLWNKRAHEDGPDLQPTGIPSIHMPRWASRITLEVIGARIERLQEISEADALAEGCGCHTCKSRGWIQDRPFAVILLPPKQCPDCAREAREAGCKWIPHDGWYGGEIIKKRAKKDFSALWNSLHGADAWDANPEVVAIKFRRIAPDGVRAADTLFGAGDGC